MIKTSVYLRYYKSQTTSIVRISTLACTITKARQTCLNIQHIPFVFLVHYTRYRQEKEEGTGKWKTPIVGAYQQIFSSSSCLRQQSRSSHRLRTA